MELRDDVVFALDIGTRTVIGVVVVFEDHGFTILAEEMCEHSERNMYDGQIHDIPRVAAVVKRVKKALEEKTGILLKKVAVAVAGRTLYTNSVFVEQEVDANQEIDIIMVRGIEMEALREAYRQMDRQPEIEERYYCVGHSILGYTLDGYPLGNLIGHRGQLMGCKVIATFLPVSVVNGLYGVLERSDLEPINLTLEPIAAMEVAIPDNLRLLNLALLDIGAGTSDLAICRDGNIVAYGMVPVAGDELTEVLVDKCLVDFNTAEKIKRQIEIDEDIHFTDIVGIEQTLTCQEVINIIEPELEKITGELAGYLIELNQGQSPRSVFCVGGGSKIPGFSECLARHLGLSPQRVVLRDRNTVPVNFESAHGCFAASGPDGVTVLGIASVAAKEMGFDFMSIIVNGQKYRFFNTRSLNVSDALALVQFNPRHLIGRNGRDLRFSLNGETQVIFGSMARTAEITINGQASSLQSTVRDGDEIFVVKAQNGEDAAACIGDYLPLGPEFKFTVNGDTRLIKPYFTVNGKHVEPDYQIAGGDSVTIDAPCTVKDLLNQVGIDPGRAETKVNGNPAGLIQVLQIRDIVEINYTGIIPGGYGEPNASLSNGAGESEENDPGRVKDLRGITVTVNGEKVVLTGNKPILTDVLKYIDVENTGSRGTLVLKINGNNAGFTDLVGEGDEIEVFWTGDKNKGRA